MLLAGCSKDADISNSTTLSGNGEKTPLLINATLDTGKGQTRAAGNTFAATDRLNVYIRHTTGPIAEGVYPTTTAGQAPSLVPIGVTSTSTSPTLSPIYWDDFSDNTDATKDLRTSGHALQSYYAYCYNGQTIADPTGDNLRDGVLTWTVQTDQSIAGALQHSDLLWSQQQSPVSYNHDNSPNFPIPFTHAMSQITVELTANAGYNSSGTPLALTSLLLKDMDIKTTLTAPTGGWDATHTDLEGTHIHDVTMCKGDYTSGLTRTFTAIVAPGTILKEGAKLLDITGADGNDYEVIITNDMLLDENNGVDKGWSLSPSTDELDTKKYIVTQPGVNYHLELRIDKSTVQVSASLENWSTVEAAGTGAIQFDDNVVGVEPTNHKFTDGSTFSLFGVANNGSERTNVAYTSGTTTTSTYNNSTDKWTNDPIIYWPNKTDNYYFRALANVTSAIDANPITITARPIDANAFTDITSGYILWGTSGGTAISPRTGGVPLEFRVVNKCKVKFTLETATGAAAMTLSEASISINNIYNTGTINLEDGTVTGDATTTLTPALSQDGGGVTYSTAVAEELAQIISTDAVVTITFTKDEQVYSTYKIPLKNCVIADSDTPITIWEGGHTYNYTIHVEQEAVKFSAAVKSWATVSGSGTATME